MNIFQYIFYMEVMSSQKLIIETINLPDDLLNYILLFLDTKKLEEIGFRFKPNEFYNNIQKEITWKPCYSEIEKKQSVIIPPKRFQQIYESYFFQTEQIKRINPVIINILSNYCKNCNSFVKPTPNIFKYDIHYILCNHIPFSKK